MNPGEEPGTIIIFDAHPDDADRWTGGLTLLLAAKGWLVHYVCVGPTTETTRTYARQSAEILGVTRHFLEIPIAANERFAVMLREQVCRLAERLKPEMVFVPSLTDYHQE